MSSSPCAKQTLVDINRNIAMVGDFNTLLTSTDRSSRQIVNKKTVALNDTTDLMNLIDIFKEVHSKAVEYTFFSIHMKQFPGQAPQKSQ